jgi:nucleotide-binding universal stress UspA family protein
MGIENCRTILVPIDFSDDSLAALEAALIMAQKLGCSLTVLHVIHDPSDRPGFYHSRRAGLTVLEGIEAAAEALMEEFLSNNRVMEQAADAEVDIDVALSRGLTVGQILQYAREHGAGLIIMGSRGRTGLSNLLMGSHAQRVVQLSPIPVMVVKAPSAHAKKEASHEA